jgi:hypothetical protein
MLILALKLLTKGIKSKEREKDKKRIKRALDMGEGEW